jgi:multidrug resistance efflux pump
MLFIVVACLALLTAYCGNNGQQAPKTAKMPGAAVDEVKAVECKGTVEAGHHFVRFLREDEKITSIAVSEGARVEKGDLLLVLSNFTMIKEYADLSYRKLQHNDKKNNLKILQLEIARTDRKIADLKKELEQEQALAKKIPDYPAKLQTGRIKKQLEGLEEEFKLLETKKDFLQASVREEGDIISFLDRRLSEVNIRVKGMEIRAPFAGVAVYVPPAVQSLRPGDPVIEVLDDSSIYIRAEVWQHQLQYVKPGGQALIFPDFFGDRRLEGTVRRIRFSHIKEVKDQYPKFPVFIDIQPGVTELKAGMSVTIKIMKEQ